MEFVHLRVVYPECNYNWGWGWGWGIPQIGGGNKPLKDLGEEKDTVNLKQDLSFWGDWIAENFSQSWASWIPLNW